jgi:transposase-like protein
MKSLRRFSKEFRAEATALVQQQSLSVTKVVENLGLPWDTVSRRVEHDAADSGSNPVILTTVEHQELTALRKQVRMLTMERDI